MRYLLLLALPLALCASASAHELSNGRITAEFAAGDGLIGSTKDRMSSLSWIDSHGKSTGNIVANSRLDACHDAREFFGQSYGDRDDTDLNMVVQGSISKWKDVTPFQGIAKTTTKNHCHHPSGLTTTVYSLFAEESRDSAIKIERTFDFIDVAAQYDDNLRAYVPRVPAAKYSTVLYPNAAGVVQALDVLGCPAVSSCTIADWNGVWFADDDGAGNGLMVIRGASSTAPAMLGADYDSVSQSNATSVLLTHPAAGWRSDIVETEYLCLYDARSWSARRRAAGKLPKGCFVK